MMYIPLVDFAVIGDGVVALPLFEDLSAAQEEGQEGQTRLQRQKVTRQ